MIFETIFPTTSCESVSGSLSSTHLDPLPLLFSCCNPTYLLLSSTIVIGGTLKMSASYDSFLNYPFHLSYAYNSTVLCFYVLGIPPFLLVAALSSSSISNVVIHAGGFLSLGNCSITSLPLRLLNFISGTSLSLGLGGLVEEPFLSSTTFFNIS